MMIEPELSNDGLNTTTLTTLDHVNGITSTPNPKMFSNGMDFKSNVSSFIITQIKHLVITSLSSLWITLSIQRYLERCVGFSVALHQ